MTLCTNTPVRILRAALALVALSGQMAAAQGAETQTGVELIIDLNGRTDFPASVYADVYDALTGAKIGPTHTITESTPVAPGTPDPETGDFQFDTSQAQCNPGPRRICLYTGNALLVFVFSPRANHTTLSNTVKYAYKGEIDELANGGTFYVPRVVFASPDVELKLFQGRFEVRSRDAATSTSQGVEITSILGTVWTFPYDKQTFCALLPPPQTCDPASTNGHFFSAGVTTEPVPGQPTWQRLVPTFRFAGPMVVPASWAPQTWDVPGLRLEFPDSSLPLGPGSQPGRLTVEGSLSVNGATLTERYASQGWSGVVVTGTALLDGVTVEQTTGAAGVHVSGKGASATLTGNTLVQLNDGAGVRADVGGFVSIDDDGVIIQANAEGVVASGTDSRALVTGGQISNSTSGPAFRATLGGWVGVYRDPGYLASGTASLTLNPPVQAFSNFGGGLYATGGSGKLTGGVVESGDFVCVQEPCPSIGNHSFTNNNVGPAFDALAGEASRVLAPQNYWGTSVRGNIETSASGSGLVEIDPILTAPPSFAPEDTAPSLVLSQPASRGVVMSAGADPAEPQQAVRGGQLWERLTEAETRARAGQADAAGALLLLAYQQATTDDERLAASEAAGRVLALAQPAALMAWAESTASLPGQDRPWARRALAIALSTQARYTEAAAVARELADEDGAAPTPQALAHQARGLSLAVEIAVAAGDGPSARASLSALAEVDPVGAAEMALSVAVAFPEMPVALTARVAGVAAKAGAATASEAAYLSVAPNPSAGVVRVSLSGEPGTEATVAVFDALGREVTVLHDGPATGDLSLSLDGALLPAGLYVVRAVVRSVARGTSVTAQTISIIH